MSKLDGVKKAAELQMNMSMWMLNIAFLMFTFIATFRPELLHNLLFAFQLVLVIPCMLASAFGRTKIAETGDERWENFDYIYWAIGYAFLINTVGILLGITVSGLVGIIFLFMNIIIAFSYSAFAVVHEPATAARRFKKDLFFTGILIVMGLLPILGLY